MPSSPPGSALAQRRRPPLGRARAGPGAGPGGRAARRWRCCWPWWRCRPWRDLATPARHPAAAAGLRFPRLPARLLRRSLLHRRRQPAGRQVIALLLLLGVGWLGAVARAGAWIPRPTALYAGQGLLAALLLVPLAGIPLPYLSGSALLLNLHPLRLDFLLVWLAYLLFGLGLGLQRLEAPWPDGWRSAASGPAGALRRRSSCRWSSCCRCWRCSPSCSRSRSRPAAPCQASGRPAVASPVRCCWRSSC